jgi:hypothetical protein
MKWALEVPMHMNPDDHSAEADEIRFHLYQQFFQRTGGKGFRMLPGSSSKRKHPRRGRPPGFNRMVAIRINALHGERDVREAPQETPND